MLSDHTTILEKTMSACVKRGWLLLRAQAVQYTRVSSGRTITPICDEYASHCVTTDELVRSGPDEL